ncbi:hypothetical protein [Methylobacillus sp.]|uniref:hypothetical protein n=1 Tax=Methylobacillus sp. TaxID=56818 RepID=UPI002FE2A85A
MRATLLVLDAIGRPAQNEVDRARKASTENLVAVAPHQVASCATKPIPSRVDRRGQGERLVANGLELRLPTIEARPGQVDFLAGASGLERRIRSVGAATAQRVAQRLEAGGAALHEPQDRLRGVA